MAIYAKGRLQFADAFNEYEEALRPGMIELETFLTYEKQLRNLQLQEARLSRRREKDIAELHELQQARQKRESEALDEAVSESVIPQNNYTNCSTHGLGFEFSEPAESSDQVNAYQAGASESAEILQRGCHVV
ncbi:MAG: hypothetical protein JO033_07640 [Acidobacteriaceae bacterium]|nr:hypothetical protein [Acidobacteriaceae bacterium]